MSKPSKLSKTASDSSENVGTSSTTREKDRISQLPDELLCTIISYLKLRDALKTRELSHRWKHVCSSVSSLEFIWENVDQTVWKTCKYPCKFNKKFVRGVNQFLQYHQGTKVSSFTICCCLGLEWTCDIDQWVRFAVAKGTEELRLHLYCQRFCCRDYNDRFGGQTENKYVLRSELFEGIKINLKRLSLIGCTLSPNFTYQLSCLESLRFHSLSLSKYDLQSLISCLVKLKFLFFTRCTLPEKLCLSPLPLLEKFSVFNTTGLEKIKLSNVNLHTFVCASARMITVDLRGAPNLVYLSYFAFERDLQYVFTCLPEQLPMMRTLQVLNHCNWVEWIPETISTFSKVTKLSLSFLKHPKFAIMKIISILVAFPSLCKFELSTCCPEDFDQENLKLDEYVPKHLIEVEIRGFYSTPKQMEFAIYLLKNASALKRLVIMSEVPCCSRIPRRQSWDEGESQMVNEKLQEFAKEGVLLIK